MAHTLLLKKLSYTIHIALFLLLLFVGGHALAQSDLQTGDAVIVSVNADSQSIDIIPLIDIESGTQLFVANGVWNDSLRTLSGSELEVIFIGPVTAGTNINLGDNKPAEIVTNGDLNFDSETHHVFIYQKDREKLDFIFGAAWGTGPVWDKEIDGQIGSDIPNALIDNKNALLTLGLQQNHQYYIRNGASGTKNLLAKFVGSESNWRSSNSAFPDFGTSFNLLEAPVVIFEQSVSNVIESDSVAILDVAIYEHDGSRLTVDVSFDTLQSILSPLDIPDFRPTTINFTGLVGNGVYEIRIPIENDSIYEGREAGIFTLSGLSGGNLGDFMTHTLFVSDDEIPNLEIIAIQNNPGEEGVVEIKNHEEVAVSLNRWKISSGNSTHTFNEDVSIAPGGTIRWINATSEDSIEVEENIIFSSLKTSIFNRRGGELLLENFEGDTISSLNYDGLQIERTSPRNSTQRLANLRQLLQANEERTGQADAYAQQLISDKIQVPGWHSVINSEDLQETFPEITFYYWSEGTQSFEEANNSESGNHLLFGYFDQASSQELLGWKLQKGIPNLQSQNLEFILSATDANGNNVLDETEGLNFITNTLDEGFTPVQFFKQFEAEIKEINISQVLYQITRNEDGELKYSALQSHDVIPSGASFGIISTELGQVQQVRLNGKELLAKNPDVENNEADNSHASIELSLQSEEGKTSLVVLELDEERAGHAVKSLNSYPQFSTQQPSVLNLAFKQGNELHDFVTITPEISQPMSFPLNFSTIESGSFRFEIETIENMPDDWEVILRDHSSNSEHNLREGFSLSFEHSTNLPEEFMAEHSSLPLNDFHNGERFELIVVPSYVEVEQETTEIEKPKRIELHQNYPNPFNPVTTISFYLPESQEVKLSVFNIVGQPIAVLVEGTLSAGEQHFEWDATDRPSGMYIYQLEVGNNVMTRKMTLVK